MRHQRFAPFPWTGERQRHGGPVAVIGQHLFVGVPGATLVERPADPAPSRRYPSPSLGPLRSRAQRESSAEVGLRPTALFDTELAGRLLGHPRVGLGTLVETVLALACFAARYGHLVDAVDLNPVVVMPEGRGVTIVDALILPRARR